MDRLFTLDQIRVICVSLFSSILAYLTPTKGFLIALAIMFAFNIWCGMRADGVSIVRCKNFKWGKFKNALAELLLYLVIIEVVFVFMDSIGDGESALIVIKTITSTPSFSRVEAGLCESTVSEQSGMCSRSEETSVRRMDSSPMLSKP